jgi:hypothetical protein
MMNVCPKSSNPSLVEKLKEEFKDEKRKKNKKRQTRQMIRNTRGERDTTSK